MDEESENDVETDLLESDFDLDGSLDRTRGVLDLDLVLLDLDLGDLDTDFDFDLGDLDLSLSDRDVDLDLCLLCLESFGDIELDLE